MSILPGRVDIFNAAKYEDVQAVKRFLVEGHVLANETNSVGQTPGHVAAKTGNVRVLKTILDWDASVVHIKDDYGQTMLDLATRKGTIRSVKMLVNRYGADYLTPNDKLQGITVLHIAASMGHTHLLKFYIGEKKMDPNVTNRLGQPAAFNAAANSQIYTMHYLGNEAKANLTMIDNNGDNILYMSARRGDLAVARYLLVERRMPFDINWRNILGETVLIRAIIYDHYQFIKFIVEEQQADINLSDNAGNTPLHEAAILGDFVLVGYLLRQGANPDAKNAEGKIPAQVATDPAVARRLEEPDKTVKKAPKVRRSVHSPETSVRISAVHSMTEVRRGLEGSPSTESTDTVSNANVNGALVLGKFLFSYLSGSRSRPVQNVSILSPPEMLRVRMDSLAVESIRNTHFSLYD